MSESIGEKTDSICRSVRGITNAIAQFHPQLVAVWKDLEKEAAERGRKWTDSLMAREQEAFARRKSIRLVTDEEVRDELRAKLRHILNAPTKG